jgi:hypothetical protein
MTLWRPQSSPLPIALLALVVACGVVALWLWGRLAERAALVDLDFQVFLLGLALFLVLVLAGMLAYLAWCAFTMRYLLGGTHLRIFCGGTRHIVPVESITDVYPPAHTIGGRSIVVRPRGRVPMLPGYMVGEGESAQVGRVVFAATAPPGGQVLVRTRSVSFGLSPKDPNKFIADLVKNRDRATLLLIEGKGNEPHTELTGPGAWWASLWADRLARYLMLGGLALNVLLFAYLSLVYEGLPSPLALHWDAQAQVDYVGEARELLRLPVFGLAVWVFNAVAARFFLPRERAATLFLLAGAAAAQLVFLAGIISIALRAG